MCIRLLHVKLQFYNENIFENKNFESADYAIFIEARL